MKTQRWSAHRGYGWGIRRRQGCSTGIVTGMTRRNRVTKWARTRRDAVTREWDVDAEPREWIVDAEARLSLLDLVEVVSLEVRSTIRFIFGDDDEE